MQYSIGVDIGGTKCAAVLGRAVDSALPEIIGKVAFPTEPQQHSPEEIIDRLCGEIDDLLDQAGLSIQDICGIGVSCGGPLSSRTGTILSPPNLPGWDNIHITEILSKRFSIPCSLENDANACALAEWLFGAGQGTQSMVFLTFGTGMGAGLILDGRLYAGASDMAGEVGHMRLADNGPVGYGKQGSFEGFCSGGGIAQLAKTMILEQQQRGGEVALSPDGNLDHISAKTVAEAAANGDELAREIYRVCGEKLGRGLSIIVDVLNPERIVIGSIFARSGDLLWPAAENVLKRECLAASLEICKVVPSALGDSIGDYAALAIAFSAGNTAKEVGLS